MKLISDIFLEMIYSFVIGVTVGMMIILYFDESLAFRYDKYEAQAAATIQAIAILLSAAITIFGILISIRHKNKLVLNEQKNKLVASLPLFYSALKKFDIVCEDCASMVADPRKLSLDEVPEIESKIRSDIGVTIENSSHENQKNLSFIICFYGIIVQKIYKLILYPHPVPCGTILSDQKAEIIIDLISLRMLIQWYYLYGNSSDTDDFKFDIDNIVLSIDTEIFIFKKKKQGYKFGGIESDKLREYINFNGYKLIEKFRDQCENLQEPATESIRLRTPTTLNFL